MLIEDTGFITEETIQKMERIRDVAPQLSNESLMQMAADDDSLDVDIIEHIEALGK